MNEPVPILDLIPYEEMSAILRQKFNATHAEIKYWVKKSMHENKFEHSKMYEDVDWQITLAEIMEDSSFILPPYASDLPFLNLYEYPPEGFFHPDCYFYERSMVLRFIPPPPLRFVYQKDLTAKRNWNDYKSNQADSMRTRTLSRANECGILRFYDPNINEFTTHANKNQIWCHTFEGEAYMANPDSVFLLYDILNVERIFFNKDRNLCLSELKINQPLAPKDNPKNVVEFNKKK
jgi:hypothetical protein